MLQVIVVRLAGGICHSSDKYLTPVCNTHTRREPHACQTLQLQCLCWPAGCPLTLSPCEKLFWPDKRSLNLKSGTLRETWKTQVVAPLLPSTHSALSPAGFSALNFPTVPSRASRSICMQRHITVSLWVLIVVGDVPRTQKDISLAVGVEKRRKGVGDYFASWVVCPHLWENSIFTFCN